MKIEIDLLHKRTFCVVAGIQMIDVVQDIRMDFQAIGLNEHPIVMLTMGNDVCGVFSCASMKCILGDYKTYSSRPQKLEYPSPVI